MSRGPAAAGVFSGDEFESWQAIENTMSSRDPIDLDRRQIGMSAS